MNQPWAKSFATACIYVLAPFALVGATLWWAKSDAFRPAEPATPAPYFDEKLDVLNRRVARTEKVAASNPSSVEASFDYSQSLFDRGAYVRLMRPAGTSADEGIDDVVRAAEFAEKLTAQNPRLWLPAARCCAFLNRAADILSQRNRGDDRERAISFLKRAIETSARFLISNPETPELLAAVSSAHLSLGNALARRGGKNDLV
ncbi:MAG: hypothetical protein ACKVU2_18850, partial [Saprospiraceae bacterium]